MKNIWSMALSPTITTANHRASWLPIMTPPPAASIKMAKISVIQPQARRLPNT
jgi:hypothetical protein